MSKYRSGRIVFTGSSSESLRGDATWATAGGGAPGAHDASHENGGADEISVAGLSGLLADAQTPATHTHAESEITGLVSDLAGKAAFAHGHAISDVTGLQSAIDGKQPLATGTPTGSKFLRDDNSWQTPSGGGGALTLTEVEKDLGASAQRAGSFDITGFSGLTADKQVLIAQKAAPYTGKGTLYDEIEMDSVQAAGYVLNATTIRAHWTASGPVLGNVKFGYAVGA